MKERPIIFSAPMVRAILEGRKTQTRRIVKPMRHPYGEMLSAEEIANEINNGTCSVSSPYGIVGDLLWVKESIQALDDFDSPVQYCADGEVDFTTNWVWKKLKLPSIFCPKGLSRIDLEITNIRVERLNDISEEDAIAEGVQGRMDYENNCYWPESYVFSELWESINGAGSWAKDPLVWVIEFKRVES